MDINSDKWNELWKEMPILTVNQWGQNNAGNFVVFLMRVKVEGDKLQQKLSEAQQEIKEQCPDVERCLDLPSDPTCDGCNLYYIFKILRGSNS